MDPSGILQSIIIKKAIDLLEKYLKNFSKKLKFNEKDLQETLNSTQTEAQKWSEQITFKDLFHPQETNRIYINLKFEVGTRRQKFIQIEPERKSLEEIFNQSDHHLIILGQVGSGKSTSMKKIIQEMLHNSETEFKGNSFPILVLLKNLNRQKTFDAPLFLYLYNYLQIYINFTQEDSDDLKNQLIQESVIKFLDELNVLLIFDGFDEISDDRLRRSVVNDLRKMALRFNKTRFILTSRTATYEYKIDNTLEYEILELSDEQVIEFVDNWLESEDDREDFLYKIRNSTYFDVNRRPIILAHLLAIYEFNNRQIPEKPRTIYRKIINLLLEEWTNQWAVERNSKYSRFTPDIKFEFLSHLAYHLTINFNRSDFSKSEIEYCYKQICGHFDLPSSEMEIVINELESHSGLFLQSGYDNFEFSHRSIQEYLAAEYIVRSADIPRERNLILSIPNEIAITISLSSNSTLYFLKILKDQLKENAYDSGFLKDLFSRLLLEKPDFIASETLGAYLIELYSACFNRYFYAKEEFKELEYLFEKLFSIVSIKKAINKVIYYDEGRNLISEYSNWTHDITYPIKDGISRMVVKLYSVDEKTRVKTEFIEYVYFNIQWISQVEQRNDD